jgi:hypothetical protein
MTSSAIEPAMFRLVELRLNQVPYLIYRFKIIRLLQS